MHQIMDALGDPTRFAIVERLLNEGELSAGKLSQPFAMSKPAVSRHLRVLEEAGLIEREVRAQFRVFRARPEAFRKLDDWLRRYRRFWETSFDRLEEYLVENSRDTRKPGKGPARNGEDDE